MKRLFVLSVFVTVAILICGCSIFRKTTPEERAWNRIEYLHNQEYKQKRADLDARHNYEKRQLEESLWQDYQSRRAVTLTDIDKRYATQEEQIRQTYSNDPDTMNAQLKILRKQKSDETSRRESEMYKDYLDSRKVKTSALALKHKEEVASLMRESETELEKKRRKFEEQLLMGKLPGEEVIVASTTEGSPMGREKDTSLELAEKPFYVHKFVDIEAVVPIDTRDALAKRLPHQAVVTFYLQAARQEAEKKEKSFVVCLYLNGAQIKDWTELVAKLRSFRDSVYRSSKSEFPQVILDQIGDVTRETVDKIIDCCFEAGIREIRSANKEPKIEQP